MSDYILRGSKTPDNHPKIYYLGGFRKDAKSLNGVLMDRDTAFYIKHVYGSYNFRRKGTLRNIKSLTAL